MDKKQRTSGTLRLIALLVTILSATFFGRSYSRDPTDGEIYFRTRDGRAWMEMERDTSMMFLIGHVRNAGDEIADTLMMADSIIGVYPKAVYSLSGTGGDTHYLFIYSEGRIFFYDEAVIYVAGKDGSIRRGLFREEDGRSDNVGVLWWDARVDACETFPPDLEGYPDDEKHGIRFDAGSKRLYVPIMEESETFCAPVYTGRYSVLEFDGNDFVYVGDD